MEKSSNLGKLRASRIKELIKQEKITQEELAGRIYVTPRKGSDPGTTMSPQNFSRCLTSGKVSEKLCRKIQALYPKYQIEWLLGYSEYPTTADQFIAAINQANKEGNLLLQGFLSFAQLSGFQIDIRPITGNKTVDKVFQDMKNHCTVTRDGKSVTFSLSELNAFENEICDYIEFRLLHMMK